MTPTPLEAAAIVLDPQAIVETTRGLVARIRERFPDASLARVALSLQRVAEQARERTVTFARPKIPLRIAVALLVAAVPALLAIEIWVLELPLKFGGLGDAVAFFQSGLESVIFIGIGVLFLVGLETRIRRSRVLGAAHELRVLAHLVDMHQLTKDPVYLLQDAARTSSSPERTMTAFELNRYLDYSAEMLALIGKVAALYGQHLLDEVAREAVDAVEQLTTGLTRKIWQKLMLLDRVLG
jgi:hypothetical protein